MHASTELSPGGLFVCFCFVFILIFETGSWFVIQAGLELFIELPQFPDRPALCSSAAWACCLGYHVSLVKYSAQLKGHCESENAA